MRQPTESKRQRSNPPPGRRQNKGEWRPSDRKGWITSNVSCGSSMSRPVASPATVGPSNRARKSASAGHTRPEFPYTQVRHNWCAASPCFVGRQISFRVYAQED